jgi:hypothetical protein
VALGPGAHSHSHPHSHLRRKSSLSSQQSGRGGCGGGMTERYRRASAERIEYEQLQQQQQAQATDTDTSVQTQGNGAGGGGGRCVGQAGLGWAAASTASHPNPHTCLVVIPSCRRGRRSSSLGMHETAALLGVKEARGVPWPFTCAVYVDSMLDGLLIGPSLRPWPWPLSSQPPNRDGPMVCYAMLCCAGISAVAGANAGVVMAVALTIEMMFLGLTYSAAVQHLPAWKRYPLVSPGQPSPWGPVTFTLVV